MNATNLRSCAFCLAMIVVLLGKANSQDSNTCVLAQPRPVNRILPAYTPLAKAACTQGSVAVLVDVASTGKVVATEVMYGHSLLRRVAERAAREWTFDSVDAEAASRREVIRFTFKLVPFGTPKKRLEPLWISATDVEIRGYPPELSCEDCTERKRRELSKTSCGMKP